MMIEPLFFSCYYAFLLGDIERTGIYYDLLKEEFKTCGSTESLKAHQLSDLSRIRESLRTKTVAKNHWLIEPGPSMPAGQPVEMRQTELVRLLHENCLQQLQDILADDVQLYNLEHPCPPYGRVDMVYKGKETIYPVEVKKDCGEHDLVGQIGKYDLYHRLQLHYKHYDFVQSVTICRSYQKFALDELKRMGVVTLVYSGMGKDLKRV